MDNIWDRFETIATPTEVETAQNDFAPIDAGDYDCTLTEIKPSETKQGLPMIKGKFKCIDGSKTLCYNQVLQNINNPDYTKNNIASAVTFISKLLGEKITFTGMSAFAEQVSEVPTGTKYTINVSYGDKDFDMKFPRLKVVKRFGDEVNINEDLPFTV